MKHIPTLDGWRGVAISMVLIDHAQSAIRGKAPILSVGLHGVTLFFVLSGFLITTLLTEELARTGSICLFAFYTRRFFRLMPAAWLYLLTTALLLGAHITHEFRSHLLGCIFFFRNFQAVTKPEPLTQHFWSLSIEEQFYLVWPLTLLLLRRHALWLTLAGAALLAEWRFFHWPQSPNASFATQYHADALLIGCALALLFPILQTHLKAWMIWPLLAALGFYINHFNHDIIPLGECIVISLLLATTVAQPRCAFSRAISWKPLGWLGLISYSVYIWQQPFTLLVGQRWSSLAKSLVGLAFVSLASYFCVEKPMRQLGHHASKTIRRSQTPEQRSISVEST